MSVIGSEEVLVMGVRSLSSAEGYVVGVQFIVVGLLLFTKLIQKQACIAT